MANLRDIKRRIRSVKNTGKITRAMQLVAASKMKKAQDQAVAGRPYAQLLAEILHTCFKATKEEEIHHPLLEDRELRKRGILVISTDKGLCGGLNANLFRKLTDETGRENTAFVTIGRKATQFITRTGRNLMADFTVSDEARFGEVRPAVELLLKGYFEEDVDSIEVLYSRFINNLKQEPALVKIAPLSDIKSLIKDVSATHDYTAEEPMSDDQRDIKFEPAPAQILEELLPLFVKREIYHMVLEAKASEHSARMVAMKTATDNAKELVDRLTLDYNKARQAAITQEIVEISTATAATAGQ